MEVGGPWIGFRRGAGPGVEVGAYLPPEDRVRSTRRPRGKPWRTHLSAPTATFPFTRAFSLSGGGPGSGGRGLWGLLLLLLLAVAPLCFEGSGDCRNHPLHLLALHREWRGQGGGERGPTMGRSRRGGALAWEILPPLATLLGSSGGVLTRL